MVREGLEVWNERYRAQEIALMVQLHMGSDLVDVRFGLGNRCIEPGLANGRG